MKKQKTLIESVKTIFKPLEKGFNEIDVNIWDDYHDDRYAILNNIEQKTRIFVEEYDNMVLPDAKRGVLETILNFLNQKSKFDLGGAKISKSAEKWDTHDPSLDVVGLTHEKRETLLINLLIQNLEFRGMPLNIYSES